MRRALVPLILVSALFGIAAFSAFEVHHTNLNAHLVHRKDTKDTIKKEVVPQPLANGVITQAEVNAITEPVVSDQTTCIEADSKPPLLVPIKTCVWWVLRITVTNTFDETMDDVVVTDNFAAELFGEPLDSLPVHVKVLTHTRGGVHQQTFITQVRMHWCVTGEKFNVDPGRDEVVGTGDDDVTCKNPENQLFPGESETLEMLVFTKLNPNGQILLQKEGVYDPRFQEYTSPCTPSETLCYQMNSGAVAKWKSKDGHQCQPLPDCPSTDPIDIGTIELLNSLRINTDIDFGTVYPGQVLEDDFVVLLSESFLDTGNQALTYAIEPQPMPCPGDGSDPACPAGSDYPDITPYLTIVRDPLEGDPLADACCVASGAFLNSKVGDTSDRWIVTFTAPDGVSGQTLRAQVAIAVAELLK